MRHPKHRGNRRESGRSWRDHEDDWDEDEADLDDMASSRAVEVVAAQAPEPPRVDVPPPPPQEDAGLDWRSIAIVAALIGAVLVWWLFLS